MLQQLLNPQLYSYHVYSVLAYKLFQTQNHNDYHNSKAKPKDVSAQALSNLEIKSDAKGRVTY